MPVDESLFSALCIPHGLHSPDPVSLLRRRGGISKCCQEDRMLNDRVTVGCDHRPQGQIQNRPKVIDLCLVKRYAGKPCPLSTRTDDMFGKIAVLGQVRCGDSAFLISPEVIQVGSSCHWIALPPLVSIRSSLRRGRPWMSPCIWPACRRRFPASSQSRGPAARGAGRRRSTRARQR